MFLMTSVDEYVQ